MTTTGIGMTMEELNTWTTTVSPAEAARRLGLKEGTLANWRWQRRGPRFLRVGRRVRYRLADIAAWIEAQTRTTTCDPGTGR
jgi:excisionase family DNA binding protein